MKAKTNNNYPSMKDLLEEARIINCHFPVKGESGWYPYGYKIVKNLIDIFESEFDKFGFEEISLPTFVKGEIFLMQCKKIKDFSKRVFWSSPFMPKDRHVLKSTIEAQISALFKVWLDQGRQPPFKFYTCRAVGRYETGKTIPLWKERNVWPFFEAHSAHKNMDDLLQTVGDEVKILKGCLEKINLPVFIVERPKINKRLKEYSEQRIEAITITPEREVVILSSIYNLGNIFSNVFGVKSKQDKPYPMVNFAFGSRTLGALFAIHVDDYGLRIPLALCPLDLRIVIINPNDSKQNRYGSELQEELQTGGYKVDFDNRNLNLGAKLAFARKQSIPLIFVIGGNEVSSKSLTVIERTNNKEIKFDRDSFFPEIKNLLDNYSQCLSNNSTRLKRQLYKRTSSLKEATELCKELYLTEVPVCSEVKCIEQSAVTTNAEVIGSLYDKRPKREGCMICHQEANQFILLGHKWRGEK